MLKVAILGATGYTGLELVRILAKHPKVEIAALTSESFANRCFSEVYPAFQGLCDIKLEPLQTGKIAKQAPFVFSALPHKEAMKVVPHFLEKGCKVVDLSADFRFQSVIEYETWYEKHAAPELLKEAVYGLPEINRAAIKKATLVGNPGCYPTATVLALIPLVEERQIRLDSIISDAKSGVSGAGRSLALNSHFCEVNESVSAYKVGSHRHAPEMEQVLSRLAGEKIHLTFTPHLVPIDRGILATVYARSLRKWDETSLLSLYRKRYQREPFVRLLEGEKLPSTKTVRGTNYCDIAVRFNPKSDQIIVIAAIDNLTKGASGQAVQNMNLMSGFPETMALESLPLLP